MIITPLDLDLLESELLLLDPLLLLELLLELLCFLCKQIK